MLCLNCESETSNPKFCSKSCSATYNNKFFIKRHTDRIYVCPDCGNKKDYRAKACRSCLKTDTFNRNQMKTLREIRVNSASKSYWAELRKLARLTLDKAGYAKKCRLCDFDASVDACHIKPISSFSLDALVSEVNSLNNLVYLCPNHHVMLDMGLISPNHIEV